MHTLCNYYQLPIVETGTTRQAAAMTSSTIIGCVTQPMHVTRRAAEFDALATVDSTISCLECCEGLITCKSNARHLTPYHAIPRHSTPQPHCDTTSTGCSLQYAEESSDSSTTLTSGSTFCLQLPILALQL